MTEQQQKVFDLLLEKCFVLKYVNIGHDQSYRCIVTMQYRGQKVNDNRREFDITFQDDEFILSYIDVNDEQNSEESHSYDKLNEEFYNDFITKV